MGIAPLHPSYVGARPPVVGSPDEIRGNPTAAPDFIRAAIWRFHLTQQLHLRQDHGRHFGLQAPPRRRQWRTSRSRPPAGTLSRVLVDAEMDLFPNDAVGIDLTIAGDLMTGVAGSGLLLPIGQA